MGVLRKEKVDRPPVACTGGMMNAGIADIMKRTGHGLPEAHHSEILMAELAHDIHEHTGFENLGVPFDVTVEAEVIGSEIDFGTLSCEPKVVRERFPTVSNVVYGSVGDLMKSERIHTIASAACRLSRAYPDVPVIGNITGPITTAASIINPLSFLKGLRKEKEDSHRVIDYVSSFLMEYARLLVESGATLICIGDPTASGEIVGPGIFEEYAVRYLNKIIDGVHAIGAPVIVHICGDLKTVRHLIVRIKADAISVDAMVNLKALKHEYPEITTMGNISTYLLEFGPADRIARKTERLVKNGVDIISPACGLSTSTSLENIRAMTGAVKEGWKSG